MITVSVIIPAYNASHTIKKCIDSIRAQTYNNIEIIVVNDGSIDNTLDCLFEYNDSRILIINNTNQGALLSRLDGVKHSTGEYVMFVDSDDWIDKMMIEDMVNHTKNGTIDFVMCGYILNKKKDEIKTILAKEIYGNKNIRLGIVDFFLNEYVSGPCGKLIKKSLITKMDLKMPFNICLQEDLMMNIQILSNIQSFISISKNYYHYVYNSNSMTHRYISNKFKMTSYVYNEIEKFFDGYLDFNEMNRIRWLYFKNYFAAILDLHLSDNNMSFIDKYKTIQKYTYSIEMEHQLKLVNESKYTFLQQLLIKLIRINNIGLMYITSYVLYISKYKLRIRI